MRKLLNTLYILTPNAYLQKDGENVVVRIEQQEAFRIPIHNIEAIVSFSYLGASPGLMQLCVEHQVKLSFHTPNGKYIGSLVGESRGNVLLRRTQYRIADDDIMSAHIAKIFIAGKVANHRAVLSRYCRDHHPTNPVDKIINQAILQLKETQSELARSTIKNSILGLEGHAAQCYWSVFDYLILNKDFTFNGRSKRPPKDMVNALLSFFYTILSHDVRSALETVGLDAYVGFFHTDRPGRASLALDLMEEMRAYLVDRFVLSVINKRQVSSSDFIFQGENGVILTEDGRRQLLSLWQKRKRDTITHPYLKESIPIGLLPYTQAMLLTKYLRGDLDNYPVFLIQ